MGVCLPSFSFLLFTAHPNSPFPTITVTSLLEIKLEAMAGKKKKTKNASSTASGDNISNLQLRGGASIQSNTLPRLDKNNIVVSFNNYFGNITRLENWQKLCRDVGLDNDLSSIAKCKQVRFRDMTDEGRN